MNIIKFHNFNFMPGKVSCLYSEFSLHNELLKEDQLYFELNVKIIPSANSVALVMASLCGQAKYSKIIIDLEISKYIKVHIENFCKSELVTSIKEKTFEETFKDYNGCLLNFSGGFDSLAAKSLMPEGTKLVFMDFGGMFAREREALKGFEVFVVSTNLTSTHFTKNSWTFMGIGAILFNDLLKCNYITFGNILEATPINIYNSAKVANNPTLSLFSAVGLTNTPYVLGLTEIGTALIVIRNLQNMLEVSLKSLAHDGEVKKYRKQLIILSLIRKFKLEIAVPSLIKPNRRIDFGKSFADDFLCFYLVKHLNKQELLGLYNNIPSVVFELAEILNLSFYERVNVSILRNFPLELREELFHNLTKTQIANYKSNDYIELHLVSIVLAQYHSFPFNKFDIQSLDFNNYKEMRENEYIIPWDLRKLDSESYILITPNKVDIRVTDKVDLNLNPIQYQSTLLWYHSLVWLRFLIREYKDYNFVKSFLESYFDFMNTEDYEKILSSLTSRDHLIAEQIRTMTYLLSHENFINNPKIQAIIMIGVNWSLKPGNIANNNHGMMLALALLHTPIFTYNFRLNRIINYIPYQLIKIIGNAFDNTGLCKENTPAYHKFYIWYTKLIIREIACINSINGGLYTDIYHKLENILEIAESSLRHISLPNGDLPPFGDGNILTNVVNNSLENSEFFSIESGFYSFKQKKVRNRYFSVKCGYSSIVHKHCDDTSIFYYYDDMPIITDAGFLNYDWNNVANILVKSQRGHSSAVYSKFDKYYPGALYNDLSLVNNRVRSFMRVENQENMRFIYCNVIIDKQYHIERIVKFSHLNNILIFDKFSNLDTKDREAEKCIRFLIPCEHFVEHNDNVILISNEKFRMKLKYTNGVANLYKGITKDNEPYKGWITDQPFVGLKDCWLIEIKLGSNENYITTNLLLEELT